MNAGINLLFSAALLAPLGALAQSVNKDHTDEIDIGTITPDGEVGPVGIVDELEQGHSYITNIMITTTAAIVNEDYIEEEIFYEAAYVDYENEKLVVWLDLAQAYDPISEDDIQEDLGLEIPIEINYGYFIAEAASSEATSCPDDPDSNTCYFWGRYVERCLPERTTSRCTTYTALITGAGYDVPTLLDGSSGDFDNDGNPDNTDMCITQPETLNGYMDSDGCPDTAPTPTPTPTTPSPTPTPTPTTPSGSVVFSEDFEGGLGRWTESGQREWQTGIPDDRVYVPGLSSSNRIAEADDCDDEACILTLSSPIDLTGYSSATLEFWRFVDSSLDSGEYLAVQLGNSGSYSQIFRWSGGNGDDRTWHKETYDLSSYLDSRSFTVRFLTEQSKGNEDVGIDGIRITGQPKGAAGCTLDVDARLQGDDIRVTWNSCDDIRKYKVYPVRDDNRIGSYSVYSGTAYTYTRGQEGIAYAFDVRAQYNNGDYTNYFRSNQITIPVADRIPPVISVPNSFSLDADSANGRTVTYAASAHDAVDGRVIPSCTPSSGSMFAVGETTVTCTARDSAGNSASKSFVVTVTHEPQSEVPNSPLQCTASSDSLEESHPICVEDLVFSGTVQGGESISSLGHFISPINGSRIDIGEYGTMTIAIKDSDGIIGFLTSSHIIKPHWVNPEIRVWLGGNDSEGLGIITQNTNVYSAQVPSTADIAFVRITDITPPPVAYDKILYGNTQLTVSSYGGLYNIDQIGKKVYIAGSLHDGFGSLQYKNATVVMTSYTLTNQGLANYPSASGDSGSPIFHYDSNNKVELLGAHVGKGCKIIKLDNGEIPSFSYSNNMTNICDLTNTTPFKVFSPWENIWESLNLQ